MANYSSLPWHQDSLHLAVLPGLEVALLRGNVLQQLPVLIPTHLNRIFNKFTKKICFEHIFIFRLCHLLLRLDDTVGGRADVPGHFPTGRFRVHFLHNFLLQGALKYQG